MKTDLFNYTLPEDLIAFHPPAKRDGGRLLVLDPNTGKVVHATIRDLPGLLPQKSLLIGNNTRVIPARLRGRRPTGGAVEILLVRPLKETDTECRWLALIGANKPIKPGDDIHLKDNVTVRVEARRQRGESEISIKLSFLEFKKIIKNNGEIPLPPYIKRAPDAADKTRYQTVFAHHDGSVAAPTAGLHFTDELIKETRLAGHEMDYVTLHVGPGTFRPILADNLDDHRMDEEFFSVGPKTVERILKAKKFSRPIMAIGTTVVRTLEGATKACGGTLKPSDGFTDIFISPPYDFSVVDGLLTNFHLPKSTLLCLVSALADREMILNAYAEAVKERYRFYSYGDAMLILPRRI